MQLVAADGARIRSATLVNPGSPFGFGGTKGVDGQPCWPDDFAGSGGGVVNTQFARYIGEKYRGSDDPLASPRVVMNRYYWKPPFVPSREEELLDGVLSERVGSDRYPGDFTLSAHYPFVAPGIYGPANALSPKYLGDSVGRFVDNPAKPPILWIRGADDEIVSDRSLFCFGTLGLLGVIPEYPGEEIYPPQPMVSQTRYVLDAYAAKGGRYREVVMADTGHSPYIERPDDFMKIWAEVLTAARPLV
jgi:pimeloyl-ACP methyl ester carboxylesterase